MEKDPFSAAILMLKSIAHEGSTAALPSAMTAALAHSGREQLRAILRSERACVVLARGFFEAALLAESAPMPAPGSN
jgi:hypothetical protein